MGIYMSVINILKKKFQRDLRVSYIFFIECFLSKYVLERISATMHFTLIVTWSGYSRNQRNHFTLGSMDLKTNISIFERPLDPLCL